MKGIEYSPFTDVYVPYIQYPDFRPADKLRMIWESVSSTQLPFMTRWVIYQALRGR